MDILEILKQQLLKAQAYLNSLRMPLPDTPQAPQTNANPGHYDWSTPEAARYSLRRICDEEGLTWDQKNLMSKVVHCESGYHTNAIHDNGGSVDHGICQWNSYWHSKEITPEEAVNDPEKAVRLMCAYVKAGKINQWVCYSRKYFLNYSA